MTKFHVVDILGILDKFSVPNNIFDLVTNNWWTYLKSLSIVHKISLIQYLLFLLRNVNTCNTGLADGEAVSIKVSGRTKGLIKCSIRVH